MKCLDFIFEFAWPLIKYSIYIVPACASYIVPSEKDPKSIGIFIYAEMFVTLDQLVIKQSYEDSSGTPRPLYSGVGYRIPTIVADLTIFKI